MKRSLFPLVLALAVLSSQFASASAVLLNQLCLVCHGDSDIQGVSTDKIQAQLFVAADKYRYSVHGDVPCIACHRSKADSTGFQPLHMS